MKSRICLLGIIAILAIIGLGFIACKDDDGGCNEECLAIGAAGEGGGIIFYHAHAGFNVVGLGTCHYLEAAPVNQEESSWSSTNKNVTGATGTAIGTGKANTAAIIAAHPGDTTIFNAAKTVAAYKGGGKTDWFLPSQKELNEMYKKKSHLGISAGWFLSSSQLEADYNNYVWVKEFFEGEEQGWQKDYVGRVRAVRAF